MEDPRSHLFWYQARCPDDDAKFPRKVRVYDGDTCRLDWDLGKNNIVERVEFRLWGINAPELNNPATKERGIVARDALKAMILGRRDLMINTLKDATDSLGSRYMVKIYVPQPDGSWLFVNDELMRMFPGEVVEYMRG